LRSLTAWTGLRQDSLPSICEKITYTHRHMWSPVRVVPPGDKKRDERGKCQTKHTGPYGRDSVRALFSA